MGLVGLVVLVAPLVARAKPRPRPTVLVIGADGITFDLIDPLVKRGRMPNFARLLDQGARAILLSEKPMRSPALWTTIATGQPRSVHNIYDFVTGSAYWPRERRADEQRLVTSRMRAAPALWNLLNRHDMRSLVVGWLNTWPAERINGVMLAPYVALNESRQATIKGRLYRNQNGQSQPPELYEQITGDIVQAEDIPAARLAGFIDEPPDGSPLYIDVPVLAKYVFATRWSISASLTNARLVEKLARQGPRFDLVMTYFDGGDTLAHRFWILREPIAAIRERLRNQRLKPELAEELKRRFGHAVDAYYELLDEITGRLLKATGENTYVLILSDHGWGTSEGPGARHTTVPFDGEHRMDGVFIAHGPGISHGRFEPLDHYAITPTILYLLGLPVPEDLPGKVAETIMKPEALLRQPRAKRDAPALRNRGPRSVEGEPVGVEAPHDETEIERLRALGYIE